MNEIVTSVSKLIDSLTPALQKLSELFGVGIDQIKAHGMDYVMAYGKYQLANSLVNNAGISLFLGAIISAFIMYLAWCVITDSQGLLNGQRLPAKRFTIPWIITTLAIVIFVEVATIIPYFTSPEIYSVEAVLNLVKGG